MCMYEPLKILTFIKLQLKVLGTTRKRSAIVFLFFFGKFCHVNRLIAKWLFFLAILLVLYFFKWMQIQVNG